MYYGIYLCVHIISALLPLPLCLTVLHPFITLQVQCSACHSTTAILQHSGASLYSTPAASHSTLLHVLTTPQLYPTQHSDCTAAHCCIHLLLQHTAACLYNTLVALQHTAASTYHCGTLLRPLTIAAHCCNPFQHSG